MTLEPQFKFLEQLRGQRTKRINLYAKCGNSTHIKIKCTLIMAKAKVIALEIAQNQGYSLKIIPIAESRLFALAEQGTSTIPHQDKRPNLQRLFSLAKSHTERCFQA